MFAEGLFTIPKTWKQPWTFIHTDERIKNMYIHTYIHRYTHTHTHTHRHTQEYYSTIRKNEIPFATIWMDPDIIKLSDISERKTNIIYHLYVESKKTVVQMNLLQNRLIKLTVIKGEWEA